jgi:hypothetical protein
MPGTKHGRGGAPAMWGRAERQAGEGAGMLFARLEPLGAQEAACIALLERLIARLRAGEWSDDLADLLTRAAAMEQATDRQPAP